MRSAERVVWTRWLRQRAVELVQEKADALQRLETILPGHPRCRNAARERIVILRMTGSIGHTLPWSGGTSPVQRTQLRALAG